MTVGIAGLGLIGGSFARAYSEKGHEVLAFDIDRSVLGIAKLSDAVAGNLDAESLARCDLVLICLYRKSAEEYLEANAANFGPRPLVIDCCGTKRKITEHGFTLSEKYGFAYIGGHPMAGTHKSGFSNSRSNLFNNAPMVLVPRSFDRIDLLERARELLQPAGFGKFSVTTAENHDRVIAFTSQLAHVVSSSYIKSETSRECRGFSAGSYRDMTRVAFMNEEMWSELFLDNRDNLVSEIDSLICHLSEYREALESYDREKLKELIAEGRKRKEESN